MIKMPNLSNYLYRVGIIIYMYYQETQGQGKHHLPHVHITYKDNDTAYDFINMKEIDGDPIKKSIKKEVEKWLDKNRDELLYMWNNGEIYKID